MFRTLWNTQLPLQRNFVRCILQKKFHLGTPSSSIQHASIDHQNEVIVVKFGGGRKFEYPWIFLQDNCTCPECYHDSSKSRRKLMSELDLDKKIVEVSISPNPNEVRCSWSDGHQSNFSQEWLLERRFTEENVKKRSAVQRIRDDPELFGSDYKIIRADFDEVLTDPARLLSVLKVLCRNGVFILEGAPRRVGELRKLVEKFGFIRTTHYGDEFTVKSERNASNIAYTSTTLGVHADLPYYTNPPSVQLLHCIKQYDADSKGGMSMLVDGFQVASQLKTSHPESYHVLSTVPLEFEDIGQDFTKFHKIHHSPTFVHTDEGKLTRIAYSNQQLSSYLPIPIGQVKPLYQSLKLFTDICYEAANLIKFKLNEGDILVFDNWRILHGRQGFDVTKGDRHLEGCYVDWDEIYSSIRVIEDEMAKSFKIY